MAEVSYMNQHNTQAVAGMGKREQYFAAKSLLERWKRFSRRLGDLQARVILSVFYFLIFGPFALILRLASDPLSLKSGTAKGWLSKSKIEGTPLERAAKQF